MDVGGPGISLSVCRVMVRLSRDLCQSTEVQVRNLESEAMYRLQSLFTEVAFQSPGMNMGPASAPEIQYVDRLKVSWVAVYAKSMESMAGPASLSTGRAPRSRRESVLIA
ncbi:MAG: hypothetical protein JWO30_1237 [Fibrobacteres bacterium]|nr:hypothetical protein [Fibrobacterota bacterium]